MPKKIDLTTLETEQLKSLFASGMGARKIAAGMGKTLRPIKRVLASLGLKHPKGYVNYLALKGEASEISCCFISRSRRARPEPSDIYCSISISIHFESAGINILRLFFKETL